MYIHKFAPMKTKCTHNMRVHIICFFDQNSLHWLHGFWLGAYIEHKFHKCSCINKVADDAEKYSASFEMESKDGIRHEYTHTLKVNLDCSRMYAVYGIYFQYQANT